MALFNMENWIEETRLTFKAVDVHAEKLLSLGMSDETFRSDRPIEPIISILEQNGIPPIQAADIIHRGRRDFARQHDLARAPLAVFWDVENVPIPASKGGQEVANAIKEAMKPFGKLEKIQAYFSIGKSTAVSEQKRSELQLSACTLIDTPHHNRKEVADKMIIVDALMYAMTHLSGCTICLITGDTDFAYMLSRLKDLPHCRTIVVTNDEMRQVLIKCANMQFTWTTDVLKMPMPPTPMRTFSENAKAHPLSSSSFQVGKMNSPLATRRAYLHAAAHDTNNSHVLAAVAVEKRDSIDTITGNGSETEVEENDLLRDDSVTYALLADKSAEVRCLVQVLRKMGEGWHLRSRLGVEMMQLFPLRFREKQVRLDTVKEACESGLIRLDNSGGKGFEKCCLSPELWGADHE